MSDLSNQYSEEAGSPKAASNDVEVSTESVDGSETISRWNLYWRGSIVLSLLLLALGILISPTWSDTIRIPLLALVLSLAIYPFFLIARSLFNAPVVFIFACIALTGTPLFLLLWGGLILFFGRMASNNRKLCKSIIYLLILATLCTGLRISGLTFRRADRNIQQKTVRTKDKRQPTPGIDSKTSSAIHAHPTATPTPLVLVQYDDDKGYYSVELPEYKEIQRKNAGSRSKKLISYGPNLYVTIIANTMKRKWDAKTALSDKTEGARQGRAGIPSKHIIVRKSVLMRYPNADGYLLALASSHPHNFTEMKAFVMVDRNVSVTISIACTAENMLPLFEIISESIQDSIMLKQPIARKRGAKRYTRSAKPTPTPRRIEINPEQAMKRLKIQGVMRKKGQNIALIDGLLYHEGDLVNTTYGGQDFHFRIKSIGSTADRIELENIP